MKQNVLKYLLFGVFIGALSAVFITCKDNDDEIKALQLSQQEQKVVLDELLSVLEDTEQSLKGLSGLVSTAVDSKVRSLLTDVSVLKLQVENHQKVIGDTKLIVEKYLTLTGGLTTLVEQVGTLENTLGKVTYDELATLAGLNDEVKRQEFATLAKLLEQYQARISELEIQTGVLDGDGGSGGIKKDIEEVKSKLDENLTKIKEALFDWDEEGGIKTLKEYLDHYDYVTKANFAELIGEDLLILKLKSLITGITLVKNSPSAKYVEIPIYALVPAEFVFGGKGISDSIIFKKGEKQTTGPQSFIVQVTPANVDLKDYNLSFVNSQSKLGEVNITKVEKYTELLTRGETGLFKITIELGDTVKASKPDESVDGGYSFGKSEKEVRYAFTVDKTIAEGEKRSVLTEYDILFTNSDSMTVHNNGVADSKVDDVLNFNVTVGLTTTPVNKIKNRYDTYPDLRWKTGNDYTIGKSTEPDLNDKRDVGIANLDVELGQAVKVELTGKAAMNAFAYYVVLDIEGIKNKTGLREDTIKFWKDLVTGDINKVIRITESKSAHLFVANNKESFAKLKAKEVGLRLFAVNADGTLVDPDGRAFYLTLTNKNTPITFTTTIDGVIPTPTTGVVFDSIPIANTFIGNMDMNTRKAITSVTLDVDLDLVDKDGKEITGPLTIKPLTKDGVSSTWDDVNLTKISIDGYVIPSSFGASTASPVTGTITVQGKDGEVIGKYAITLKRAIELKVPPILSNLKESYSVYLSPTDGKGTASLDLDAIFAAVDKEKIDVRRLQVVIDSDTKPISTGKGESTLILNKEQIATALDGKLHTAKVNYNYGYIYSKEGEYSESLGTTKFLFFTELQSITWDLSLIEGWTPRQGWLAYGTDNTISLNAFTAYFKGVDYTLVDKDGNPKVLNLGIKTYTLVDASVITTSAGSSSSNSNVYYTVKVAPKDGEGKLVFTPTTEALVKTDTHVLQLKIQDVFEGVTYTTEVNVKIQ